MRAGSLVADEGPLPRQPADGENTEAGSRAINSKQYKSTTPERSEAHGARLDHQGTFAGLSWRLAGRRTGVSVQAEHGGPAEPGRQSAVPSG